MKKIELFHPMAKKKDYEKGRVNRSINPAAKEYKKELLKSGSKRNATSKETGKKRSSLQIVVYWTEKSG